MTFEDAYAQHSPELRRWLTWRFGEEIVDDAMQEGFLYAWQNWPDATTSVQNMKAWLFGVAKYAALHMLRGSSTKGSRGGAIAPFWGRNYKNAVPYDTETDPRQQPPEQGLAIYVAQLRSHFGCLGPAQQEVLNALAEGETAQEFAERSGRSQQAVSAAVQLGRKRVREKLGDAAPHVWD